MIKVILVLAIVFIILGGAGIWLALTEKDEKNEEDRQIPKQK